MPDADPFAEMKAAENPQRRSAAIHKLVRTHPLAVAQMEMGQRAAAQKAQMEAQKLNAENLQKHIETIRKTAHNAAQEHHWDDTANERNLMDAGKRADAKNKARLEALKVEQATHDALGNVSSRLHVLGADSQENLPQREMLNHIMNQKDPKAIEAGIKYYDTVYPHEMIIGGQKAVGTPSGPRFVPQPAATHGKMTPSQLWLQQNLGK